MAEGNPARVVYDCVVFLQGAGRRHSPARRCLELADAGTVRLCLSPAVLTEIEDVLGRPVLRQKFPLLTSEDSTTLLRTLRATALLFTDVPKVFTLPRDPDDEAYTDLAIAAGARYLVTWNERHLTYLMKRDTPEGRDFCERFPAVKIVSPPEFLREIDARPGEEAVPLP
jgi:putative PIN family toxin of toxin-antitoxin system